MLETSARLLRLLSLLQSRRSWTGGELAARLEVSTRTIRNDVDRLRRLGYAVDATSGAAGGYRLVDGGVLPPLLLDDDDAVAIAVGLRTAAARAAVTGLDETSVRTLAKLQQVLPSRLRHRVEALLGSMVPVVPLGPTVDADVLTVIAGACRDAERIRFDYRTHDGTTANRSVEPHRLVSARGRWYLVAWDLDRDDWRTFRVDRLELRRTIGPRFVPRELPGDGDVAQFVDRGVGAATWEVRARVRVHAPVSALRDRLPAAVRVLDEPDDGPAGDTADGPGGAPEGTCLIEVGSDSPEMLAVHLGMLGVDFTVTDPPELVEALRTLADRYRRAIPAHPPTTGSVLPAGDGG
ncbi:MAG TPA: WYL domain-containing protein [Acidimicrobiales bacterium]|nr:WYL domain-containing protein [Acidimicrobiales bacterium]